MRHVNTWLNEVEKAHQLLIVEAHSDTECGAIEVHLGAKSTSSCAPLPKASVSRLRTPVFLLTGQFLQVLDAFLGQAYQERTAKMADVVKGVALFTCGYALRERTHFAQVKGLVDG